MTCRQTDGCADVPEGYIDMRMPIVSIEIGSVMRPDTQRRIPTIRIVVPPFFLEGGYLIEKTSTVRFETRETPSDHTDYHVVVGEGLIRFGFRLDRAEHKYFSEQVRTAGTWGLMLEGSKLTFFLVRTSDGAVIIGEIAQSTRFLEAVRKVEENIAHLAERGVGKGGGEGSSATGKFKYN